MSCEARGHDLPVWATSTLDLPLVFAAGRLGFFGPTGTFTEEALRTTLAAAPAAEDRAHPELVPFPTIPDTLDAVSGGLVDCAIVPIENSIEGTVSVTVDVLAHEVDDVQIVREVQIPIRHRLIARPGVALRDIETVVSHPHANAQCRSWLRAHLPGIEVEAANSTADAVQRVAASDRPWAAIGTAIAAEAYGCVVLEKSIEDHDDNETRFILLSRTRERQDLPEPYKTSVVCKILRDQPGALLLILQEFAHRYINLTKIESRPSKRGLGDYIFLIDMEGRVDDPQVTDALRCLACKLLQVKILGSYPVGVPSTRTDAF
ncbi:MAG: prephenate dehydratase [Thermoleophilia bacterium]|nr:prephenate dehydratase [Thermoleophilia bacterium]